jgi:hypothetical protein
MPLDNRFSMKWELDTDGRHVIVTRDNEEDTRRLPVGLATKLWIAALRGKSILWPRDQAGRVNSSWSASPFQLDLNVWT